MLGGSGSINGMIWARGDRSDYDGWAAAGNPGWDFHSVLPLFKQSEAVSYTHLTLPTILLV